MKIGIKIGVSPTNIIYTGNTKKDESGLEILTKREDVADESIMAVVQFMYQKSQGYWEMSIVC